MGNSPNRPRQFWQELRRRNVVRVITVYAGAALVILELGSMSEKPFGLPEWTFVHEEVLLSAGFFIALLVSWIYDIHPGEGIRKTRPDVQVNTMGTPVSFNGWKIASYMSFVVITALILLHVISRIQRNEDRTSLDRSIAVLPFVNLSNGIEFNNLGDALTDELIMQLFKINAFQVRSRTPVLQFKDSNKPI